MANSKATKKALFMSMLSLLLCFTMLMGATFAWFTDTVTSKNNIIKSGTLEVGLYWADGTEEVPADESTDWKDASTGTIFDYDKWEPGYTEVRHIKIANEGTLALKYMLKFGADGDYSDLASVIDVYYVDPAAKVEDRTDLDENNKLGTLAQVLAGFSDNAAGELLEGEEHTVTFALKMQESATNEYQDKSIGANFAVTLLATQLTAEDDSFDDQYDKDALYPTLAIQPITTTEELKEGFEQGGTFVLGADVTIPEPLTLPAGKTLSIDMAGHDFIAAGVENALVIRGDAKLTNSSNEPSSIIVDSAPAGAGASSDTTQGIEVKSTGTLTIEEGDIDVKGNGLGVGVLSYGTVNLNDGTITVDGDGHNMYGIFAYGGTVNMNGGEIVLVDSGMAGFGIVSFGAESTINLNSGKISVIDPDSFAIGVLTGTANVTEGSAFTYDIQAGEKYYCDSVATLIVNGVAQ